MELLQGHAITTAPGKWLVLRPIPFVYLHTCLIPKAQTFACSVTTTPKLESSKTFGTTAVFDLVSPAVLSVKLPKHVLSALLASACLKEIKGNALKAMTLNSGALEVQLFVSPAQPIAKLARHLLTSAHHAMTGSILLMQDAESAGLFVRPATIKVSALYAFTAGTFIKAAFNASLVINQDR
jgi:hypothetical protein